MTEYQPLSVLGLKSGDLVEHHENGLFDIVNVTFETQHPKAKHCIGQLAALSRNGEEFQPVDESDMPSWRVVSRCAPTGPVRTVTRSEVVRGEYGRVVVTAAGGTWMRDCFTADELRVSIATLTEIADALEAPTQ